MRGKNLRIKYLVWALVLTICGAIPKIPASAEECKDVRIIFARGSGSGMTDDANYDNFVSSIESKLKNTSLSYDFVNLDYTAVSVGDIGTLLGAYFGAGEAYKFGESVDDGVGKLINKVNNSKCENTKFVLGGYSQGAMVISKALPNLKADRIIYAATFGDPKIYLPEGEGILPAACRGESISQYRAYVPDCYAFEGLLGSYRPYQPEDFTGKLGTWCNRMDIMCSSHFSISSHMSYVSDNLYEDASRTIFDKITTEFGIKNTVTSPHDVAIVIDSTGSMETMFLKYRLKIIDFGKKILESGGRVALYDYRDLLDPYTPVKHCDFNTCDLDTFVNGVNSINVTDGGDDSESLLSASFNIMNELDWNYGSTKSILVLTDAGFLNPDRDGVTLNEVIKLSKEIDPVNFYIITKEEELESYLPLAQGTDGEAIADFDGFTQLADSILLRFDSLPRVEENVETFVKPKITILEARQVGTEVKIKYSNEEERALVIIDDAIIGVTTKTNITINNYLGGQIRLVPLGNSYRGDGVNIVFDNDTLYGGIIIPKAPNTGIAE